MESWLKRKENNMTQEEKDLLLMDLCSRSRYPIKCKVITPTFNLDDGDCPAEFDDEISFIEPDIYNVYLYHEGTDVDIEEIKPYLRPFSDLTEKEIQTIDDMTYDAGKSGRKKSLEMYVKAIDFLIQNHIDIHGLIPKGLALEAPRKMYK